MEREPSFERLEKESPYEPVAYDEVPEEVRNHFEEQSARYIKPEDYLPQNFSALQTFTHENDDQTYLATQIKTYDNTKETEELTYFVDTREGTVTGYSELRFNQTSDNGYFKDKPFIGMTRTSEEYFRQGLAERRLKDMAQFCRERYGLPLYSDTVIDNLAEELWKKLVKQGEAEQITEGNNTRYRTLP